MSDGAYQYQYQYLSEPERGHRMPPPAAPQGAPPKLDARSAAALYKSQMAAKATAGAGAGAGNTSSPSSAAGNSVSAKMSAYNDGQAQE